MSRVENPKVAIVGAGSVGTSIAYASLVRRSARTVALYDVNTAKVDAEVLDLAHGTQFTGSSEVIGGADPDVVIGAHIVVITAGAKQKPGQTRLDLATDNVRLLEKILPTLLERAPEAIYVLVTNPCDVLTVAAQRISGLPSHRILSSGTVLDTSRLRWLLARRVGIALPNVHAYIVGEHGDTEFALWSRAMLGPIPLGDWRFPDGRRFTRDELDGIIDEVRGAAYKVIAGKGATNHAIGLSGARIIEAILQDENTVLPVSTVLQNYHGIDDVALSIPSIVNSAGVSRVLDVALSADEEASLHASAESLRESIGSVGL